MRTQNAKDTLILFKNSDPYGFQSTYPRGTHEDITRVFDSTNPSEIPPLGCFNYDELPVGTDSLVATVGGSNFLRSQAYYGGWRVLSGKSSFNISDESDKEDASDVTRGRRYFRGHETFTASLELWNRKNEKLWRQSIARGKWQSSKLRYDPFDIHFHHYDFLIFEHPDKFNLNLTRANNLIWLHAAVMEKVDTEVSNPFKMSIPISIHTAFEYPNWTKPTQVALTPTAGIAGGNDIFTGTNDGFPSRLVLDIQDTTITGTAVIRISGHDPMGDEIYEEISLVTGDLTAGDVTLWTNLHFWQEYEITFTGGEMTGGTLQVFDWDGMIDPKVPKNLP